MSPRTTAALVTAALLSAGAPAAHAHPPAQDADGADAAAPAAPALPADLDELAAMDPDELAALLADPEVFLRALVDREALAAALTDDEVWLSAAPMAVHQLVGVDVSAFVPVPGESEFPDEAEPLPVVEERVKLVRKGDNRFKMDLRADEDDFEPQRTDASCWAACAHFANEYNRRTDPDVVSPLQEELVHYFKGGAENQAADLSTIMRAMCLDLEPVHRANLVTLAVDAVDLGPNRLVRALSRGSMPIVGLRDGDGGGHAVVVTGVTYSMTEAALEVQELNGMVSEGAELLGGLLRLAEEVDAARDDREADHGDQRRLADAAAGFSDALAALDQVVDAYALRKVRVLDPWDEDEPRRVLTGEEFREQVAFIMTRELALEIMTGLGDDRRVALGEVLDEELAEDEDG